MSISGILSSALSSLTFNASRLGAAADNIANVSTNGYKGSTVVGKTLVTHQATATGYSTGGVQGVSRGSVSTQGLLRQTTSNTDLAISGRGFFVVDPGSGQARQAYSRDGSFRPDSRGDLVNASGARLLGYPTDSSGARTSATLEAVNINRAGGTAEGTSKLAIGANLPANAGAGQPYTVDVRITGTQGNSLNLPVTFTKSTAPNTYTVTVGSPVNSNTGVAYGTPREGNSGGPVYSVDVQFDSKGVPRGFDTNGDGTIDSTTLPGIFIEADPATGGGDLAIELDLGTVGKADGLTQFSGEFVISEVSANGTSYGQFSAVTVAANGQVTAHFNNGEQRVIYEIPVATFTNPEGLAAQSGNVYQETDSSGQVTLRTGGVGGAGTVQQTALEQSNVDLGTEFVRVIQAQAAYSFGIKVLRAGDELAEELLDIKS